MFLGKVRLSRKSYFLLLFTYLTMSPKFDVRLILITRLLYSEKNAPEHAHSKLMQIMPYENEMVV